MGAERPGPKYAIVLPSAVAIKLMVDSNPALRETLLQLSEVEEALTRGRAVDLTVFGDSMADDPEVREAVSDVSILQAYRVSLIGSVLNALYEDPEESNP